MQFAELLSAPLPAGGECLSGAHPRMRVSGGVLYVLCESGGGQLIGNSFDLITRTWRGAAVLANGVTTDLGVGLRFATSFSFDIGIDANGQPSLRVMYVVDEGGTSGKSLVTIECNPDLTGCSAEIAGWSTRGQAGGEVAPSLRFGGGRWMAAWLTARMAFSARPPVY